MTQNIDQIYQAYHRLIYQTAYRVTRGPEDAEDVVQTLFLRLLCRGLPAGIRHNPKGYLYRSAVNLSLNAIRSRRRETLKAYAAGLRTILFTQTDDSEQTHNSLGRALGTLNKHEAEILVLRYVDNRSDTDIAKLFGTSRGAIAVRLYRTRSKLRKLMSRF